MRFPRFVIAGAVNSGLTYIIYLMLLSFTTYVWAYTVAYLSGIVLGYLLNSIWVFQKRASYRTAAAYPLTYGINYIFGLIMLKILIKVIHVPKELAPLIVLAVSVPLMYVLTRTIFTGKFFNERNIN